MRIVSENGVSPKGKLMMKHWVQWVWGVPYFQTNPMVHSQLVVYIYGNLQIFVYQVS